MIENICFLTSYANHLFGMLFALLKGKEGRKVSRLFKSEQDVYQGSPHIVVQWADLHNSLAQARVKADPTHGACLDDCAKIHPNLITKWIKDNPGTPQPKADDLVVIFFENFSRENPGKFPSANGPKGFQTWLRFLYSF
jgi:hypothetical protein